MSDYSLIAKVNNNDTFLKSRTQDVINRNALQTRVDNTRSFTLQNAVDYNEERFKNDFTNSLTAVNNKYEQIKELYKQFYNNGISYDKDGNPIQGADATDYADRYQFAEFLHELYPDLSVDYFMRNAEDFIYRATGVKADVKSYWDHIGNIAEASWKNAGNSLATVMEYFGGSLTGKFGTKDFQNTKEERAKKTAVSGSSYRKDLGDEKYDGLIQKMFAGTIEQSPQMAMVAGMTILSLATGGISGTGGITGLLAMKNIANANKIAKGFRIAGEAANFFFSGLMDAGDFMAEVSQAGASDEAAYAAGLAILASTGFLETWGDDTLLKPVDKIAKSIFNYKDNKVVNQAVKSAWKIIGEGFLNKTKQVGMSEVTETAQEEVEYLAGVFAKQLVYYYEKEHGNLLDKEELGITGDQVVDSIVETAKQTLLSTPFMTLGSSVIASGVDLAFGPTSAQWTPKKYMNKEGATHVRGTQEFVEFGEDIVDPNLKDGENGKPNPIKAHTVGSYTFIDGKISQAQYDLLKSDTNKAVFTTESSSKLTKKDASTLKSEANKTETTLKADVADSYLAAIEKEGNLDSYGYETKGKIVDRNDGDATALYITLKDTGETIKIDIGTENSEKEKLDSLKDFTNVEFHSAQDLHHIEASDEDIKKAESRQEKLRKKQEEKQKKEEEKQKEKEAKNAEKQKKAQEAADTDTSEDPDEDTGETSSDIPKVSEEDEEDFDVFAGTAKEGQKTTVRASIDKAKHNNGEPIVGNSYSYFANKYKPKEEKTSDGKKKKTETKVTPIAESHVYLNENGQEETKDIHNATIMEMRSADGNVVERVEIKNLGDAKIKDLLQYTKDGGSNSLDTQTKTSKVQNAKKNEAYADAGVTPNSTEPVRKMSEVKEEEEKIEATKTENETIAKSEEKTNDSSETQKSTESDSKDTSGATVENKTEETAEKKEEEPKEKSESKEEPKPAVTPVTAKEVDDLVGEIEKDQKGVSKDRARQMALLAKGLKDIFEFMGKKFDYAQAGKFINSSLFAKADSLNKLLDNFIDGMLDHPNGKELFKILTNNAKFTKTEKAVLKQKMLSYLKGNTTDLSDTAINYIDQLYGPLKGALNITETLNEEDRKLAEQVKREEQKEEVKEEKAPKEEKTEAEKEIEKRKENYRINASNLALRAWKYCDTQADSNSRTAKMDSQNAGKYTKAAEMFEKLAAKYKAYYEDIRANGYSSALKFATSWDARTAESWAAKGKIAEWKTKNGAKVSKKLSKLPTTEEIIAERAKYALDYYKKVADLQVRRNGEEKFLGVTSYELGKLNLALNEGLHEKIDDIVTEIIAGIPQMVEPKKGDNYLRNENGEIVLDENKKPKYVENPKSDAQLTSEWKKAKALAAENHILDIYEYLYSLVEAGGEDVATQFVNNVASLPIEGDVVSEGEGEKKTTKVKVSTDTEKNASLIAEDLKPLIAYSILGSLIADKGKGNPVEAIQKFRDGKLKVDDFTMFFDNFAENTAWLIDGAHKDSLLYMDYANYWKNVQTLKSQVESDDTLKNQFVGLNAVQQLKEEFPSYYDSFKKAEQLRDAGTPIEEIWRQTGWFWGVDGKWRMEIPDVIPDFTSNDIETQNSVRQLAISVIRGTFNEQDSGNYKTEYKLSDFYGEDNFLFKAYPNLKDFPVIIKVVGPEETAGGRAYQDKIEIYWRQQGPEEDLLSQVKRFPLVLVHEVQHQIQTIENFARGGNNNTNSFMNAVYSNQVNLILSIVNDIDEITIFENLLKEYVAYGKDYLVENLGESGGEKSDTHSMEYLSGKGTLKDFFEAKSKMLFRLRNIWSGKEEREFYGQERFETYLKDNNLINKPLVELTEDEISSIRIELRRLKGKITENRVVKKEDGTTLYNVLSLFGIDPLQLKIGSVNEQDFLRDRAVYERLAGETEARLTARRYENGYENFPLSDQDRISQLQIVMDKDGFHFDTKDSEVLKYEHEGISSELSAAPFEHTKGRDIDYLNYKSSFEFDNQTGRYYINANNVYNEILTVMTATYPEGAEVDMPALRQKAKLASIFISSLSEDAQDAIVRRSTDKAHNNGKLLTDTNEALLRLFFTPDELNGIKMNDRAKGATFSDWSKIFLTTMSDENTVTHEIGHILFTLDASFRERAVKEYKEYFEKDKDGESIRAVVNANPENFGGMSADAVIKALHRLTEDDYDFNQKSDLNTEETVQYMFQTWWQGKDTLEYAKGVKGLFEKVAAYIKKVAERIMNFFGVDILHETNNKVFSPLFTNAEKAQEFMNDMKMKDVDFHQFDRPEAKTLTVSQYGGIRVLDVDNELVLTHGVSSYKLDALLAGGGKMIAPSLALTATSSIPQFGMAKLYDEEEESGMADYGAIFLSSEDIAKEAINNGWVYEGDAYTPNYVGSEYKTRSEIIESYTKYGDKKNLYIPINEESQTMEKAYNILFNPISDYVLKTQKIVLRKDKIKTLGDLHSRLLELESYISEDSNFKIDFIKSLEQYDNPPKKDFPVDYISYMPFKINYTELFWYINHAYKIMSTNYNDGLYFSNILAKNKKIKKHEGAGSYFAFNKTYPNDSYYELNNNPIDAHDFIEATDENILQFMVLGNDELQENHKRNYEKKEIVKSLDAVRAEHQDTPKDWKEKEWYGLRFDEVKYFKITNLSIFKAAGVYASSDEKFAELKEKIESFGIKVFRIASNKAFDKNVVIDSYTSSVKGAAEQLLFQTVGSAVQEIAADAQPVAKKAQLVRNYEELVYRHVKASINGEGSDTKQVFADWKKSVKDFMATSDDIDRLKKKLEETGIFHNVDIQDNLSSSMRDEIKSDITKRIAYSREDYVAWTKNIERVRNNLRGADGKLVSADSPAVKEALYTLYGYREVKGKTSEGRTTTRLEATGLLSRVFAADKKGGSKWGSMLTELRKDIQKRAAALDKAHGDDERYRGMQFLAVDNDAIDNYFLNKDKWSASKAKESNNVLKGNSKAYSELSYKLEKTSTYEIDVQDIEAFLTTLVDFDGQPFIVKTVEDHFGVAKNDDGSSVYTKALRLTGPLVDLVNFAHIDESAVKSGLNKADSLLNVDEAFAWAAYNNYRNNKTYNTGNNTLEESIYLLDKVNLDYIGALEKLKNDTLLKGIYDNGLTGEQFEQIENSIKALKEDAEKRLEALEGYKLQLSNMSYDDITRAIQKGLNLINVVRQNVTKKVGPSGLSEAEVNKLKKAKEDVEKQLKELQKSIKEDKGVLSDENESEELKKVRKELFTSDAELTKTRDEVKKLREDVKKATEKALTNLSAILKDPKAITDDNVKAFLEEHEKLKKQIQGYQLACSTANTKAYEAEKALQKDTVLPQSMLKDFEKYGLSTLFTNTKKSLREVAVNKSTGEVNEKLTLLMKAIYSKPRKGTIKELNVNKALNFSGIYSSDISEKADEYYEHAEKLRKFVASMMLGSKTRPNVYIVTSTIDNLNARQLVELEKLITDVVADSVAYTKEKFKAHTEYRNKWIDAINKEIHAFAVSHQIDDTLLTDEDRVGIDSSKKDRLINQIIEQFTLQSKKYRNTYPTLYSFIFGGGLDHRGMSTGWGLNEAQNKLYDGEDIQNGKEKIHRDGYTGRAKKLQKLIMDNLSNSIFYKGKITEANFNDVINLAKRGYKTILGEADITEDDKKSVGYKMQEIQFGNKSKFVPTVDEENGSPAMREVVRYIADQEAEYLNLDKSLTDQEESLDKLNDKLNEATKTFDNTVSAISRMTSELDTLKGTDTSSLNAEELRDHNKRIADLEKLIKETSDKRDEQSKNMEKARKRVENKNEQITKLKQQQQIAAQKGGTISDNKNTYTTQELLGIYLIVRQKGGIDHLVFHPTEFDDQGNLMAASSKTNNLSIGNVIWVVQQFEDPDGIYKPLKAVADSIVDIMSSSFDAVKDMKFYLSNGETILEKVPYYFTFTVQDDASFFDLPEINIELAEAKADGKIDANARVSDSMTKERKEKAEAPLNLNVLDTVFNQLYKQEYYVAFGRELKDLTELLDNGKFLTELITAHGRTEAKAMYTSLAKYVNAIGNGNKTIESSAIDSVVRFWTNQTAAGALCFSLPNVIMQFPTILVCKDDPNIGWKGLFTAMAKALKDDEVTRLSPQIREMVNGYVDSIRKSENFGTVLYKYGIRFDKDWMQKAGLYLEKGIKTYQRWGLKLLDKANIYAAKAMWYAYYEGVKKENAGIRAKFDTQEAFDVMCANEATQRVMDITPIQQAKDNSEVYNNKGKNAWLSQTLLFTQQTGKMMNRYIGAYNEGKHNDWTTGRWIKTMGKMLTLSVFLWIANGFVKGTLLKKDDDEEEKETWDYISDAWDFVNNGLGSDVVGWDIIFNNDDYGGLLEDFGSLVKAATKDPDERTDNQLLNSIAYTMNEVTFGLMGGSAGPADKVYRSFRDLPDYGISAFTQLYNNNWAQHVERLVGDN